MNICVIAGGVGSARFLSGLVRVVDPADVTVVVNTGDDEVIRGLHVSPDVDTVLYHLAGATDWERGWGLEDETFHANDRYIELVARAEVDTDMHDWFALGDRDLATHMLRTRLLDAGRSLTEATDALRRGLDLTCRVLPMSDDPVRTVLITPDDRTLTFQEYFVRQRHDVEVDRVRYEGYSAARPAPGVIDAIRAADLIVFPPSNPVLSTGPVLALPEVREEIENRSGAASVGISPIIGGKTVKGPADRILAATGSEVSAVGVARLYQGLVDFFIVDRFDRDLCERITWTEARAVDTIMSGPEAAATLAKKVVALVA